MIDNPLWCRCSLGRHRWYWVVWRSFGDVCDGVDPIATGYAPSPDECEAAALAVEPTATNVHAGWASGHHRKLCAQRRMQKPASDSKETVQPEYLYTDHDAGWDYGPTEWYSRPHRIIKTTKRSVFVEQGKWRPEGTWHEYDVKSYRLDRHELDEAGEAWSYQARERFYTKPFEERRQQYRPQYLVDLDMPEGATQEQIKTQFRRLAKVHHPDCGGNAEDFIRIRAAYEQATSAFGQKTTGNVKPDTILG